MTWMYVAAASAGGSILGGYLGGRGAEKAAQTQAATGREAIAQ